MKRMLILALALMLCCSAALAEAPSYSPEMAAKKQAIAAVKDKYGFTTDVFGLFAIYATVEEDHARVQFIPHEYLPVQRIGEYDAVITGDRVQLSWTHDQQDPMYWQSDVLDSPCWGVRQLDAARLSGGGSWLAEYLPEDYEPVPLPSVYGTHAFTLTQTAPEDLPLEEASALADAALADVFGLSPQDVALLDHAIEPDMLLDENGLRLWRLTIADAERCFSVLVNAATGEIFDIVLTTGGNG